MAAQEGNFLGSVLRDVSTHSLPEIVSVLSLIDAPISGMERKEKLSKMKRPTDELLLGHRYPLLKFDSLFKYWQVDVKLFFFQDIYILIIEIDKTRMDTRVYKNVCILYTV